MSNILVYAGPGVSESALKHTIATLKYLAPSYDVQPIHARSLALDPWQNSTSLIVIPGGRDLPYVQALSEAYEVPRATSSGSRSSKSTITANTRIRSYVHEQGGSFLGICAGAYYASSYCDFERGTALEVCGEREALQFFPGTCQGTVYPGFVYESDAGSRVAEVDWVDASDPSISASFKWSVHYNGGGAFMDAEKYADKGVQILARYAKDDEALAKLQGSQEEGHAKTSPYAGQAAAVFCDRGSQSTGKGRALLFGVHPEFPIATVPRRSALAGVADKQQDQRADQGHDERDLERSRLFIFGFALKKLGLDVRLPDGGLEGQRKKVDAQPDIKNLTLDEKIGASLPPSITEPARLTPMVLAESRPGVVSDILRALADLGSGARAGSQASDTLPLTLRPGTEKTTAVTQVQKPSLHFSDVNDSFYIYDTASSSSSTEPEHSLFQLCNNADYRPYRAVSSSSANKRSGSSEQESEEVTETPYGDPLDLDLNTVPKVILAYPSTSQAGGRPSKQVTPYFDCTEFIDALEKSRVRLAGSPILSSNRPMMSWTQEAPVQLADAFMYGQVVTSTQTMLDKNYKFLTRLPTGFTAIATHQVSGRGRGGNSWISPLGCLQFSSILRLPGSLASGVVFVQYLAGLAIVLAVRKGLGEEYAPIGQKIRIKWPNDVYAEVGDDTTDGQVAGKEERKGTFTLGSKRYAKMAGVLVNSQFAGKDFALVVGCGVNCLNSRPTTSLSDLIAIHNANLPAGSQPLATISQEKLLGAVLATFESLWQAFLQSGTFSAFTELYNDIWLHADQETTLADTEPPTKARIVGVSSDFGMLRAVPVESTIRSTDAEAWGKSATSREPFIDLQPDGNSFDMLANLIRRKE